MADLTILSPHTFPPTFQFSVHSPSDFSGRVSDGDSPTVSLNRLPFTVSGQVTFSENQSASSSHNEENYNPHLLSPPRRSSRPGRPRRQSSALQTRPSSAPPTILEDEETQSDETDEESSSYSYTKSFKPFSYPSSISLPISESRSHLELPRPPPPLFRPKTFWKNTRRSALTGPSYSPSSYIVRRSTFIAAGLSLDSPHADLSALAVELRVTGVVLVPSTALPL